MTITEPIKGVELAYSDGSPVALRNRIAQICLEKIAHAVSLQDPFTFMTPEQLTALAACLEAVQ